jgi:hypothetical protein
MNGKINLLRLDLSLRGRRLEDDLTLSRPPPSLAFLFPNATVGGAGYSLEGPPYRNHVWPGSDPARTISSKKSCRVPAGKGETDALIIAGKGEVVEYCDPLRIYRSIQQGRRSILGERPAGDGHWLNWEPGLAALDSIGGCSAVGFGPLGLRAAFSRVPQPWCERPHLHGM